jgi:deoxyribonuclease V
MKVNIPAEWLYVHNLEEAQFIQHQLARQVTLEDDFSSIHTIGGMDVSNHLNDSLSMVYASAVVLNKQTLLIEDQVSIAQVQPFPYIPGFLGFREAPALVEAFKKLAKRPEILLVDGHGISHPRGLGIASHLGVLLDIPTIGVAKSILVGYPAAPLEKEKGMTTPLLWKGKQIGTFVRTKLNCNPLIISAGHRVSLESAVKIVMECLGRYKLPEPTRQAHLASNRCRREASSFND